MATDADAAAAGFIMPTNTSLISEGDDAIRANARTALEKIQAAEAKAKAADEATLKAALEAPNLAKVEELSDDEFGVRFTDGDYFVRANERDGITSRVGGAHLEALDPSTGFLWAVAFRDPATGETRVDYGRRTDGTIYDATRDGATTPEAGTALAAAVVVWGDSLAQNWTPTATATLGAAVNQTVVMRGRGGQVTGQIAARQGGRPTRVTLPGNTVPGTTTPVTVTMSRNFGTGAENGGTYPGSIAGVAGAISVASDGSATFARATAGTPRPAAPGTPFITGTEYRHHFPVIIAGRNNYAQTQTVVDDIRGMLAWSARGADALVLTVPPWETEIYGSAARATLDATNSALLEAFPTNCVDWGAHLRSADTLQSVGITPTATDLQNITDGVTPASFRHDAGHVNDAAYRATAALLADHYRTRGLL